MKKMNGLYKLSIMALLFSINAQAFDVPLAETMDPQISNFLLSAHCGKDSLTGDEEAMKRIDWAHACGYVNKDAWWQEFTQKPDPMSRKMIPRKSIAYPIFSHVDRANKYPIWIPDYSTCSRPANVQFLLVCESR